MKDGAGSNITTPGTAGAPEEPSGGDGVTQVQMEKNLAAIHGVSRDIHRNIREIVIGSLIGIAIWLTIGALTLGFLGAF